MRDVTGFEEQDAYSVDFPVGSGGPTLLAPETLYPDAIFLTDLYTFLFQISIFGLGDLLTVPV